MTLWALHVVILGNGPWLVIRSEENLDRLRNSTRQRGLTSDALSRGVHESRSFPYFNAYGRRGACPTGSPNGLLSKPNGLLSKSMKALKSHLGI